MKVLVSDTSVLIDLQRGGLLEFAFSVDHDFVVPDLLYEREIRPEFGDILSHLNLRVEELTPTAVQNAQHYRRQAQALSLVDSFALVLAEEHHWTLLTGDALLRRLAIARQVDCHGVLWLLDLMEEQAVTDLRTLYDGLQAIIAHPRCRLPHREVVTRLNHYQAGLNK